MALSTQRAVSNGTLQDILLTIGFISQNDIDVYVDNVLQVLDVDYEWPTANMIHFFLAVPNGQEVLLRRDTNLVEPLHIFEEGAVFNNLSMDENFEQLLFVAQEAKEGATLTDIFNDVDMHGNTLFNLSPAILGSSPITLDQFTGFAADSAAVLRLDMAASNDTAKGAGQVGWRNATAGEFLDGGWFQPNDLDITGVVDESAKVLAYLNAYKRVRLPSGTVRLTALTLPNGSSLFGNGELLWDSGTSAWVGTGTLVIGALSFSSRQRCAAGLMSVDNFDAGGNAVAGVGTTTRDIYIKRLNTRANNHGHLWEQNGSDPAGASGGTIRLEDCRHFGGPNGFAIKMRNVSLVRCDASGCDPQAFVAVSDNINGAAIYSRASNVRFIDCTGSGNKTTLRVYTRDEFSLSNTNGVLPASNIEWVRGDLSGCTEHGAHIGDFFQGSPTRTQINSEDVRILGARIILNLMRGVIITLGDRITVRGCTLGGNGSNNSLAFDNFGSRVSGLDLADNITFGSALGSESGVYTLAAGASSLNASHGGKLYKTASVAPVTISSFSGGRGGQSLSLFIDDNFTTCTVGGVSVTGKGTVADYFFDSVAGAWVCKRTVPAQEVATGYSASLLLDYSNPGVTSRFVGLLSTTTLISLTAPAASLAGRVYTLRMTPGNAGGKGITAWSSSFKFSTAYPAPTVVGDNTTTVVTFYWSGTHMVATSITNFPN